MANVNRVEMPKVTRIGTVYDLYECGWNQCFYRTDKSWELWQVEPLMFIRRWSRRNILWVIEGEKSYAP